MSSPVLVVNQNSKRETGREAQISNITAAKNVAEIIRTTLGPRSMLKMILDPMGGILMTNDGNAILREVFEVKKHQEQFTALQDEHIHQIEIRENKLKELVSTAYLSLPEDRQAALQFYLDREKTQIDTLTTLRAAQIEIARLRASETHTVAAPEGRVCLVFTDVQDSTSLWDADPDIMGAALDIHNSLMRTFIARYRGYEVKTEGDAFMIAFADPIDALQWCLDIQVSLTLCDWPPELLENPSAAVERDPVSQRVLYSGLRVRIGAHVGHPLCTKDPNTGRMDYFGPDVNRAARVSGAAHGGQVIVSGDILKLVEHKLKDELDDPVVTRLGSHKMKGLRVETELVQLVPQHLVGRTYAPVKTVTTSLQQMEQVHAQKDPLVSDFSQAPPQGRAAIVITNIMGGQRFWEEKPTDMAVAFELHGNILRDNMRKYNGYAVKSEGDKHLIAFSDAKEAVNFALSVQVDMLEPNWPSALEDFPTAARVHNEAGKLIHAGLRLAIGINFGEPICRPNPSTKRMDYTGVVVNSAARLATAAAGGQIIITNRVDEEIRKRGGWQSVDIECETQDLGSHMLHGIKRPAQLIDVRPRSLIDRQFPAPKTLSTAAALKHDDEDHDKPPQQDASKAPVTDVTFVVAHVENLDDLWEALPIETRAALDMYYELVRLGLRLFNGYEVDSLEGKFVCAFHNAIDASNFALYVQQKLLDVKWPFGLRESGMARDEYDAAGNVLQAGLRIAMGIHTEDPIASVNPETGTMNYHGTAVSTLQAIGNAAHGGQILMDKASYSAVVTNQDDLGSPTLKNLGRHSLPGVQKPEFLTEMLPQNLAGRVFPAPLTLTVAEQARKEFVQESQVATASILQRQQEKQVTAPWGDIFIVMVDVPNVEELWLGDPRGMLVASRLFTKCVRDLIRKASAFEISNNESLFVIAFQKIEKAINFSIALHKRLLVLDWPSSLYKVKEAAPLYDADGEVVLCGLRCRVSMTYGKPTRSLDPVTKRDTFIGSVLETCARMLHATRPGQTVIDRSVRVQVTNTLRKELTSEIDIKSLGEHLLTGLPIPRSLFLILPKELMTRPAEPLATATNELRQIKEQTKHLQDTLAKMEHEEQEARNTGDFSVIAAVHARQSIVKEQLTDLEQTQERIQLETVEAEAPDDKNLQALVSKQQDLASIVYPHTKTEQHTGVIDDLVGLSSDLTVANQIKLLRNEASLFEGNLSFACSSDSQRKVMLVKALTTLFRRLGIIYNLCPVLEKGIDDLDENLELLQNLTFGPRAAAARHGRAEQARGPDLEELDASEIDSFRRHVENMFGNLNQGTDSQHKSRKKKKKNRLRSAPHHRGQSDYESFIAAQSMMSLVDQASSAVQYKFPKGKKLSSRPASSTRHHPQYSSKASLGPGTVIDLQAVSREASKNRIADDDHSSLDSSRSQGSLGTQIFSTGSRPRRRRSARRRVSSKEEAPIEHPVAPQLGFRTKTHRTESDSSILSQSSASAVSQISGTGSTVGRIQVISGPTQRSRRGKPPKGSKRKGKLKRPSSTGTRKLEVTGPITRSPSENLGTVRELESTLDDLDRAANSGTKKTPRLGGDVKIGGTFGSAGSEIRRVSSEDSLGGGPRENTDDAANETVPVHEATAAKPREQKKNRSFMPSLGAVIDDEDANDVHEIRKSMDKGSDEPGVGPGHGVSGSRDAEPMIGGGSNPSLLSSVGAIAEEYEPSDNDAESVSSDEDGSLQGFRRSPKSQPRRSPGPLGAGDETTDQDPRSLLGTQAHVTSVEPVTKVSSLASIDVSQDVSPPPRRGARRTVSDESVINSSAALIEVVRSALSRASNVTTEDSTSELSVSHSEISRVDSEGDMWFTRGIRIDNVDLKPLLHRGFELRKMRAGYLFSRLAILLRLRHIQADADRVFDGVPYSQSTNRRRRAYLEFKEAWLCKNLRLIDICVENIHQESEELRRSTMKALNLLLPSFGVGGGPHDFYTSKQSSGRSVRRTISGQYSSVHSDRGEQLLYGSRSGSEKILGQHARNPPISSYAPGSPRLSNSMSKLYEHSTSPSTRNGGRRGSEHSIGGASGTSMQPTTEEELTLAESQRRSRSGVYIHDRHGTQTRLDQARVGGHPPRREQRPEPSSYDASDSDWSMSGRPGLGVQSLQPRSHSIDASRASNISEDDLPTHRRRGMKTLDQAQKIHAASTKFVTGIESPPIARRGDPSPRSAIFLGNARVLSTKEIQDIRTPPTPRIDNLKVRRGLAMAKTPRTTRKTGHATQHQEEASPASSMEGASPGVARAPIVQKEYAPTSFR